MLNAMPSFNAMPKFMFYNLFDCLLCHICEYVSRTTIGAEKDLSMRTMYNCLNDCVYIIGAPT